MKLFKFALLIFFLYLISLGISYFINFYFPLNLLWLSLIIFSIVLIIFIVLLALVMAIIKKPEIESKSYEMERIKEEFEF